MLDDADQPRTLHDRLTRLAAANGGATAILAPGAEPLTYGDLLALVDGGAARLRGLGFGRDDRLCVVAPAGPRLATAVLTVAAAASCVPLNPRIAPRDWRGLMADFGVSGLAVEAGMGDPAREAAEALGIPVIDLTFGDDRRAGWFHLAGAPKGPAAAAAMPTLHHDALLLPTSGTTSRPKVVPLSHANVHRSARSLAAAIRLTSADRLLNVLPLHHSYGLITGLISSIWAGAETVCMGAFDVGEFFGAVEEFRPTWTMGVPAIFDEVLSHAAERGARPVGALRLIHSSASPMPQTTITRIEALFGAPLIETYGMTEAASQITSNPLPPGERRLGSVGRAAGPALRVLDPQGADCPPGTVGEVVIRGPNLTRGYEGVPRERDWTPDGWFRTGDLGHLEADGYLRLVGRLREMINRGGEKISPQKVEEAMLEHPDVVEAAAFSIPHPRLGEDVGVAVVLRAGARATARGLRTFAMLSNALSAAETPRFVAFVDRIPRTATGKAQRLRLAAEVAARPAPEAAPDEALDPRRRATRSRIARTLADAIGLEALGDDDDLFLHGADSLSAIRALLRLREEFGVEIDLRTLLAAPTVAELAEAVLRLQPGPEAGREAEGPAPVDAYEPTSVQTRILDAAAGFPGLPAFNVLSAFRIRGALDADALRRALSALVARHEALRTSFHADAGGHVARVRPPQDMPAVALEIEDWSMLRPESQRQVLADVARTMAWAPIDLRDPPLFRARLLRFAPDEHALLFVFHHVICDAWSMELLFEELSALYALGPRSAALPPAPPFSAFAAAQRRSAFEAGSRAVSAAPSAKPATPGGGGHASASASTGRASLHIAGDLASRLRAAAATETATLFVALHTGLRALLGASFGAWDAAILAPVSNRSALRSASTFGPLQNHGAVEATLSPSMTFAEAMRAVRAGVLDLQAREALPFARHPPRSDVRVPGGVMFSLIGGYGATFGLPGAEVEPDPQVDGFAQPALPIDGAAMLLTLVEVRDGLRGAMSYKQAAISDRLAPRLIGDWLAILELIATRPHATLAEAMNVRIGSDEAR